MLFFKTKLVETFQIWENFFYAPPLKNFKNKQKNVRFFSKGIYCFLTKKTKSQEINKKT